jgi:hypothetical protein
VFRLTLIRADPDMAAYAQPLADYFDDEICDMVGRLEGADPAMLGQIRSEALSARMIAVLNAIERHTAALTTAPRDEDMFLTRVSVVLRSARRRG